MQSTNARYTWFNSWIRSFKKRLLPRERPLLSESQIYVLILTTMQREWLLASVSERTIDVLNGSLKIIQRWLLAWKIAWSVTIFETLPIYIQNAIQYPSSSMSWSLGSRVSRFVNHSAASFRIIRLPSTISLARSWLNLELRRKATSSQSAKRQYQRDLLR